MHAIKHRPFSQPKREVSFLHRPMYDRWFFLPAIHLFRVLQDSMILFRSFSDQIPYAENIIKTLIKVSSNFHIYDTICMRHISITVGHYLLETRSTKRFMYLFLSSGGVLSPRRCFSFDQKETAEANTSAVKR